MKIQYNMFMVDNFKIFKTVIDLVTIVILCMLPLALLVGMIHIFINLKSLLFVTQGGGFSQIISSILTVFVHIYLLKIFTDFRKHDEIRIIYVTDATILIVLREIAATVYSQRSDFQFIIGLSMLLLILGITQALAIKYPHKQ